MSLNIHKDDLLREGTVIGEKIGFEKGAYQTKLKNGKDTKTTRRFRSKDNAGHRPHQRRGGNYLFLTD